MLHPFLPITATFLCPQDGCFREVRLYSILLDYPKGASVEEGVALYKVNYLLWRSFIQKIQFTRTFCITHPWTGAENERMRLQKWNDLSILVVHCGNKLGSRIYSWRAGV